MEVVRVLTDTGLDHIVTRLYNEFSLSLQVTFFVLKVLCVVRTTPILKIKLQRNGEKYIVWEIGVREYMVPRLRTYAVTGSFL
jgi:hypothetical protein